MPVSIDTYDGDGYTHIRLRLPEGAPARTAQESFREERCPNIAGMLPSELIGVLREGGKRWFLDTGREEKKKVLDWCDEHALDLDREYLQTQIASEEKHIEEAQKRLRDLRLELAGIEEEIAEQAAAEPAKAEG